jgi:hypothetical protein
VSGALKIDTMADLRKLPFRINRIDKMHVMVAFYVTTRIFVLDLLAAAPAVAGALWQRQVA